MAYAYHELRKKTVQELRDIAKDVQHDVVQDHSEMNKDHLLPALCKALGIEMHEHQDMKGIDKAAIKAKVRELKSRRSAPLEAHDRKYAEEPSASDSPAESADSGSRGLGLSKANVFQIWSQFAERDAAGT